MPSRKDVPSSYAAPFDVILEKFVDEGKSGVEGEDDDRSIPTVFELVEPLDISVEELGVVAVVPCTSSGGSNKENEGWLLLSKP